MVGCLSITSTCTDLTASKKAWTWDYDYLYGRGVCVVEWAERAEGLLPPTRLDVLLEHAGKDRRRITLIDLGALRPGWTQEIGVAP